MQITRQMIQLPPPASKAGHGPRREVPPGNRAPIYQMVGPPLLSTRFSVPTPSSSKPLQMRTGNREDATLGSPEPLEGLHSASGEGALTTK